MPEGKLLSLAVIIATKNRVSALQHYALASLIHSAMKDFVCVIWDASDDLETEKLVRENDWPFELIYRKALRTGSSLQRNDAVDFLMEFYPLIRFMVFIDDDCALSNDALGGVLETFCTLSPIMINVPMKPLESYSLSRKINHNIKTLLSMSRHASFPFLYNYGSENEPNGIAVEWASGGGMAVDVSLFRNFKIRFPEPFQRFGGYALGEDFAFSYYVSCKLKQKIVNSLRGYFLHYHAGSARLDLRRMAASKWYNFHLLFDAIYDDLYGVKYAWRRFQFKLFMWAAALKLLFRAKSVDIFSVFKGINDARLALIEYYETNDIKLLMKKNNMGGSDS